jgi:hypothetical protein
MEARIARLESDVAHLRTDVADIKIDLRSVRDKLDTTHTKLSDKIDSRVDDVATDLGVLKDSLASTKVWALLLYITLAAGVFSTMARGFGWL